VQSGGGRIAQPGGAADVGLTVGGSTANAQIIQTAQTPINAGFQILDFAFARTPSGVEGWGVGHSFGIGAARLPLVMHLR
jgi:hypothetical protein